jgi:RND superfamily putative drug exporter
VIHAKSGKLTDPKNAEAVEQAAKGVAKGPHVASVVSPLTPQGTGALSKDKQTGYLSVTLGVSPGELSVSEAEEIIDGANAAKAAGLEVQTGGQLGQKVSKPATESSELIGIIAAMLILTLTFGTVVSMLIPIINAIISLLGTLAIIRMLGHVTSVPSVAPTLATMIGLGVGIDYALFIVTRHFRGMHDGLDRGVDRALVRHLRRGGVLRRRYRHHRARLARRRRDSADHHDGADGCDRRRRRRARRAHAAAGRARDRRPANQLAARAPSQAGVRGARGPVGEMGA